MARLDRVKANDERALDEIFSENRATTDLTLFFFSFWRRKRRAFSDSFSFSNIYCRALLCSLGHICDREKVVLRREESRGRGRRTSEGKKKAVEKSPIEKKQKNVLRSDSGERARAPAALLRATHARGAPAEADLRGEIVWEQRRKKRKRRERERVEERKRKHLMLQLSLDGKNDERHSHLSLSLFQKTTFSRSRAPARASTASSSASRASSPSARARSGTAAPAPRRSRSATAASSSGPRAARSSTPSLLRSPKSASSPTPARCRSSCPTT